MEKKTKSFRENTQDGFNTKSKSCMNTTRSLATPKPGKKSNVPVGQQPPRIFRFGTTQSLIPRKTYKKNSDKTIKPPEKIGKNERNITDTRSVGSYSMGDSALFSRDNSPSSNCTTTLVSREVSNAETLTNAIPLYAQADSKHIKDLEERLENLQSILLKKVEILNSRNPERVKKEYKFVALVVGDESKLVVKENDTKSFPSYLPSKSLEDLNRKTSEFFRACLLSFTDKLRLYQELRRPINCNEIYDELKTEEQDFCYILQDWITEFCNDAEEKTLVDIVESSETIRTMIVMSDQEVQTDVEEKEEEEIDDRTFSEQEIQTEPIEENFGPKEKELFTKMDKLRLENYELKDQLTEQREYYVQEFENLDRKYNEKFSDMMECWQQEKSDWSYKEETLTREQKTSKDLSQQVLRLKERLDDLMEKHETLLSQKRADDSTRLDLEKLRVEFQHLQNENIELQDWKSHFLKKLDHHYERIELQDKEIRLQKRALRAKSDEVENTQKHFDVKVKENRQLKESLEARNKLIDHLRNAVEIGQKKIREYELLIPSLQRSSEEEIKVERQADKMRRPKAKKRVSPFLTDPFMYSHLYESSSQAKCAQRNEEKRLMQQLPELLPDKKDYTMIQHQQFVHERLFQGVISTEDSSDLEKTPVRNIRHPKRSRDIIVKKYDV